MDHVFYYKEGPGCPAMLDGTVYERVEDTVMGKDPAYGWRHKPPLVELDPLPRTLVLVVRDPFLDFDWLPFRSTLANDYLVSDTFYGLLDRFELPPHESAVIETVHVKGRPLKSKSYRLLRFPHRSRLAAQIDVERSRIDRRKTGEFKKVWSLALLDQPRPALFTLEERTLWEHLFCSSAFRDAAETAGLTGVGFLPVADIGRIRYGRLA